MTRTAETTFFHTAIRAPEIEALLAETLPAVARDVASLLEDEIASVCLGGGYGRGEGGVRTTSDGRKTLFNDLDFFVFTHHATKRRRRRIDAAMREIARKWEGVLGVAIDFGPAKNRSDLSKDARSLMMQELKRGCQPVYGDPDPLECVPALPPEELPWIEAVRLLLNRGMGLLFALERMKNGDANCEFVVRNIRKAELGAGDAILLASGRYRWRARERQDALEDFAKEHGLSEERLALFRRALKYKFEPDDASPPGGAAAEWNAALGFWQEAMRRVAGTENDDPDAIERALSVGCRRNRARSLRHAARWILRGRRIDGGPDLFADPIARLAAILHRTLFGADACAAAQRIVPDGELLRLWRIFN